VPQLSAFAGLAQSDLWLVASSTQVPIGRLATEWRDANINLLGINPRQTPFGELSGWSGLAGRTGDASVE